MSIPAASPSVFVHPYAAFLASVEKPSRYIGGEFQQVSKPADEVDVRVCLAFPDVYEIGMSHLGTKILYAALNKTPGVLCERAFAPWMDMEAQLRTRGLPLLSLETATPLSSFDVLGFSLQYELTYTNVLNMLDLGGLPLRSANRADDAPLILAGGPTATHPEPLAPFIDAFFIGEAEETLAPLCLEAAALRRAGIPRRERLIILASKYALYVPELYTTRIEPEAGFVVVDAPVDPRVPARPKRIWVADINKVPFPDDSPLPFGEAIFDRMAVEIARGCTEGCRFCQAGMIYRPVRERDPVAVLDALVEGVRKGGYDETSLTCLSTADYSCVTPLVKAAMAKMRDEKVSLSVSSLRAYGLNDDLLADMATMKAQGLTFAPEAGTQRMRDVITKNVTEEDITESAQRVFSRGFRRMKLYFMIGLPTETDVDVLGIVETAARVSGIGRRYGSMCEVTASVSTHVPKPHTPFQWCAMDTEAETERKQTLLSDTARKLRVTIKMHENYQSHLEGIFSRGDRHAGALLERAFHLGCRFDSWDDALKVDAWEQAIAEEREHSGFMPERYLGTIPITAKLPWDHIDIALDPDFMVKEYRKAMKDRLSPPCGKPFKELLHPSSVESAVAGEKKKLICYDCGVACDLTQMKEERLYFLRRMNAWTPPVLPDAAVRRPSKEERIAAEQERQAADPDSEPVHEPTGKRPKTKPPTRIVQGPGLRYRLKYTKQGRVIFLGHLDLLRHLPRVFRRAGIELYYTEGFHPKPEMSFGPALGLGVPALGEIVDVKLGEAVPADELIERLNAVTLDGIKFLAAAALSDDVRARDASLGRVLYRAEYAVRLPDELDAASGLALWAGAGPISILREERKSGLGRTVDVRKSVFDLRAAPPDICALLAAELGWTSGRIVRFTTSVTNEGSARPREVLRALWGEDAVAAEVARLGLWGPGQDGLVDPMDTARLQPLPRRASQVDALEAPDSDSAVAALA